MYHTHFNSIHSTQIYLRDNLAELKSNDCDILVSTDEQTLGIGRKGSQWDSYQNSIALSFTIRPNPVPTLTPIEIGILTAEFLKKEFDVSIFLKWPNDLITRAGKKCGGIIAQYIDTETVIAGLGLNLGALPDISTPEHYKHGLGAVADALYLSSADKKEIPSALYSFLLKNRIGSRAEMQTRFNKICLHMGKIVEIDDDGSNHIGKFLGLGQNGEALLEIDGSQKTFLSSSLTILN